MTNTSKKPQLSINLNEDWTRGQLRVDAIRNHTLVQMAAAWCEPGGQDDIVAALDQLADVVSGDPSPEELDSAVEVLDDAGCETLPLAEIGLEDALRLRAELDAVITALARFNTRAVASRRSSTVVAA